MTISPINDVAFVYRCESCGYWYVLSYNQTIKCPKCNSIKWLHTATIDPVTIVMRYLNKDSHLRCDLTQSS